MFKNINVNKVVLCSITVYMTVMVNAFCSFPSSPANFFKQRSEDGDVYSGYENVKKELSFLGEKEKNLSKENEILITKNKELNITNEELSKENCQLKLKNKKLIDVINLYNTFNNKSKNLTLNGNTTWNSFNVQYSKTKNIVHKYYLNEKNNIIFSAEIKKITKE